MFTSETAKLAGLKSGESRRAHGPRQFIPLHIVEQNIRKPVLNTDVQTVIEQQLVIVEQEIRHTRKELNDAMNDSYGFCPECKRHGMMPHHRAQLLKALDTLLDRQRKLMQIPDPAQLKIVKGTSGSKSIPEPL